MLLCYEIPELRRTQNSRKLHKISSHDARYPWLNSQSTQNICTHTHIGICCPFETPDAFTGFYQFPLKTQQYHFQLKKKKKTKHYTTENIITDQRQQFIALYFYFHLSAVNYSISIDTELHYKGIRKRLFHFSFKLNSYIFISSYRLLFHFSWQSSHTKSSRSFTFGSIIKWVFIKFASPKSTHLARGKSNNNLMKFIFNDEKMCQSITFSVFHSHCD